MNHVAFHALEYGDGTNTKSVAIVAGFGGKAVHFEQTAKDLASTGHDVVVYDYDNSILLEGDGKLLPQLIEELSKDFINRTSSHTFRRYAGASLGGGIAWNMQKGPENVIPGLYAAVGADAAMLVMKNRLFRSVIKFAHKVDILKAFENNDYTLPDLQEEWATIQTPPTTPFTVAYGGLDYVVRQSEVMPKVAVWQESNNIRVIQRPLLGHTGIIKWFQNHSNEMLEH